MERLQSDCVKGGYVMSASRDEKTGKWTVQCYYENWKGEKKHKKKRGFATKKEALEWEREFLKSTSANMEMMLGAFVDVYFQDKAGELKERTIKNKQYMIEAHVLPYFANKRMNEITPSDIIQWQNEMRAKGYSQTYLRMVQNQITALFTHACNIYNLGNNPCKKVKKMGKADADKLNFWTKAEYDSFIRGIDKESRYFVIFEILFWTGCREGDDDDKIRLNQRKPSKYKGLSRFGPEKNLQRINKFMKERPIFYKNLIQMKENIRFYLRCFYCITKVMILQFNSENRTELARNG